MELLKQNIVKSRLPYDAEVEWIESTGTQAISLGNVPYGPDRTVEQKVQVTGVTNCGQFVVANGCNYCFIRRSGTSSAFEMTCNTSYVCIGWQMDSNPHVMKSVFGQTQYSHYVDNVLKGTKDSAGFPDQLISSSYSHIYYSLFGRYTDMIDAVGECSMHRLFWLTIRDKGGNLVCDLIPVRADGKGCLYDRVSGELLRNAGTGEFIIGPDKA